MENPDCEFFPPNPTASWELRFSLIYRLQKWNGSSQAPNLPSPKPTVLFLYTNLKKKLPRSQMEVGFGKIISRPTQQYKYTNKFYTDSEFK